MKSNKSDWLKFLYVCSFILSVLVVLLGTNGFFMYIINTGVMVTRLGKNTIVLFLLVILTGFLLLFLSGFSRSRIIIHMVKAQNFENAASFVPNGIFRAKLTEGYPLAYANDAYYELYGFVDEEDAGQLTLTSFMSAREQLRFKNVIETNLRENKQEFEIETKEQNKHGQVRRFLTKINLRPEMGELYGAMTDVTERRNIEEKLLVSEEEYRLAATHSGSRICRYDIRSKAVRLEKSDAKRFSLPVLLTPMPGWLVDHGLIAEESEQDYLSFFAAMDAGGKSGTAVIKAMSFKHRCWRWYRVEFTAVFTQDGEPRRTVITYNDITQLREQELAFERMTSQTEDIPEDRMASFECSLTKDTLEEKRGTLFKNSPCSAYLSFNERTKQCINDIHPEDRARYAALLSRENLIAAYYDGKSGLSEEFRRCVNGSYIWVHAAVQLIRYYNTNDIRAYIVFLNIDEDKKRTLELEERSKIDALTGLLNRRAFCEEMDHLIQHAKEGDSHVLVMLDLDRFKDVNDILGHTEGDKVLKKTAARLSAMQRKSDITGRLGGDEFVFCLTGMNDEKGLKNRLAEIATGLEDTVGGDIFVSASLGAAVYPKHGTSFDELYQKADKAMYTAKRKGRSGYDIFNDSPKARQEQ